MTTTKIVFTGLCEYYTLPYQQETELYCMATLQAPSFESKERKERKGIDLVCVVDKSGSMAGQKLDMVKSTLNFMFDQLKPVDRVAIVEFDTDVTTSLQLTNMDDVGMQHAKKVSSKIQAGSCTNLSDALFTSLKLIASRKEPNEVTSVILFTDGLANRGLTTTIEILNTMKDIMDELINTSISVFTFGFGNDTDANMLASIAKAGNGLYDFLETTDDIPKAFGNVIGNLLSVVGQNIKVSIEPKSNISLKKVLTGYRMQDLPNGAGCQVNIGDLYSEEKKDVVFVLSLPKLQGPLDNHELAKISLSYFNIIETESELVGFDIIVHRNTTEIPSKTEANYILDIQKNRVQVSEAMTNAKALGDQQQLGEGRQILLDSINKVETSVSSQDNFCQGLIKDLRTCLNNMADQTNYMAIGNRMLNNCYISNDQQRSTSNPLSVAQAAFSTPQQQLYSEAFSAVLTPMLMNNNNNNDMVISPANKKRRE